MSQIYRTVVGNQQPDLAFTVERNGEEIDVTDSTVTLTIKNERTGQTTNGNHTCVINDATHGGVTYSPGASDFPTEDRYIGDCKVVYDDDKPEHIQELLLILVRAANS